ncbi:Spy/CpxP family protein refolding chaperone [Bradyrhizobium sp. STM 3557]|uniref:Spy/CpxP family protein refolding chaperone n=1 Tax=Bradyrhizobium sp. STM 3557 TaxID=578920 RepID=UPI00388F6397
MRILRSTLRTGLRPCVAIGAALVLAWSVSGPRQVDAQGLFKGLEQGAREGNKAAGPVGGVLGGAIGGVVGVVTGVTGTFAPANSNTANNNSAASNNSTANGGAPPSQQASEPNEAKKPKGAKASKATKLAKAAPAAPSAMLTQQGVPELTAEQIVATSDANIERIKKELNLTAEQEKNWGPFASAMHYLGHNGADRLNLRIARAKRDPPDDIIEQMRNEAQFLVDRAADQRNVADSAEPLFATLDDKQKQLFIDEMVRLSHERGLD